MESRQLISHERLLSLLHYDPDTGDFTRLVSTSSTAQAGMKTGCINSHGYLRTRIDGYLYINHRLAWFYVHAKWPEHEIDHINGVTTDNRIANLREATHAGNSQNFASRRGSTSAYVGVHWHAKNKKWLAQIGLNGRKHALGSFESEEEAASAYAEAKARLHTFSPIPRN